MSHDSHLGTDQTPMRPRVRQKRRKTIQRAVVGVTALTMGSAGLLGAFTPAYADWGGSGGTTPGNGGGTSGSGWDYRFWAFDNPERSGDALNMPGGLLSWDQWDQSASNMDGRVRPTFNEACTNAINNAIATNGGTAADYRIVLAGGFIGDYNAGGGKTPYLGAPPVGGLQSSFEAQWAGMQQDLNALVPYPVNIDGQRNASTPEAIAAYRQYVHDLALQAMAGANGRAPQICVVLAWDQPIPPPLSNYNLAVATSIEGRPTAPGQSGTITDYVSTDAGGSAISENLSGVMTLYWDWDFDGVRDAYIQKPFSTHNATANQPGASFSPTDFGAEHWLGDYWIDTYYPQQGGMSAEVTHYGQHDPQESFSIRATPAIGIIKYDTGSGFPAGDRNTPDEALTMANDTPITFWLSNQGNEPLSDITFSDATTAGTGVVEDLAYTSDQGAVSVDPATGFLMVNGARLVLAPGEGAGASGVLRGVGSSELHTNLAKVDGVGIYSGSPVSDDDPWNGKPGIPDIEVVKWDLESGLPEGDRNTPEEALVIGQGVDTVINFDFTNTGEVALTDITLTDNTTAGSGKVEDIAFTSAQGTVTLDETTGFLMVNGAKLVLVPGESVQAQGTLRGIVADDPHTNLVTVTGKSVLSGEPVEDEDPWNGKEEKPAIDLVKWDTESGVEVGDRNTVGEALQIARDLALGVTSEVGVDTSIDFEFVNTGDAALTNLTFGDTTTVGSGTVEDIVFYSEQGEVTVDEETGFLVVNGAPLIIVPGEAVQAQGNLVGVTANADHTNDSTIHGVSVLSGQPVWDEDPWNGKVEYPSIKVIKWDEASGIEAGDRNEADDDLVIEAEGETGFGKDTVIKFDTTNDGDVAITDLTLVDETTDGEGKVEEITFTSEQGEVTLDETTGFLMVNGAKMILAPGETVYASGILRGVPVGADHTNNVTVTGKSVLSGYPVDDEDPWNGIVEDPSISLIKFDTTSGNVAGDRNEAGQALTVTGDTEISFLITNTGNVDLDNLIFGDSTTAGTGDVDKSTIKFSSAQGEVHFDAATGLVSLKAAGGTLTPIVLAPGETLTATGTLKGVQAGTSHTDLSTIEGETPTGKKVTDDDPWNGQAAAKPSKSGLASTGASGTALIGGAAALALAAGVVLTVRKRRSDSVSD